MVDATLPHYEGERLARRDGQGTCSVSPGSTVVVDVPRRRPATPGSPKLDRQARHAGRHDEALVAPRVAERLLGRPIGIAPSLARAPLPSAFLFGVGTTQV